MQNRYSFESQRFKTYELFLIFYFFAKFLLCFMSWENLKILKSWEQINGAKKPVRKTSATMFFTLGIKSKKVPPEKFLNNICKK